MSNAQLLGGVDSVVRRYKREENSLEGRENEERSLERENIKLEFRIFYKCSNDLRYSSCLIRML